MIYYSGNTLINLQKRFQINYFIVKIEICWWKIYFMTENKQTSTFVKF